MKPFLLFLTSAALFHALPEDGLLLDLDTRYHRANTRNC